MRRRPAGSAGDQSVKVAVTVADPWKNIDLVNARRKTHIAIFESARVDALSCTSEMN